MNRLTAATNVLCPSCKTEIYQGYKEGQLVEEIWCEHCDEHLRLPDIKANMVKPVFDYDVSFRSDYGVRREDDEHMKDYGLSERFTRRFVEDYLADFPCVFIEDE